MAHKTYFNGSPVEEYQNDIYRLERIKRPCVICGKATSYKSKLAADHICSRECAQVFWHDIFVKLHTDKRRKR
tara:strand:- start:2653 stop:2871 length:219 start_codon:yes stop_codon:yes gene_type:complete